MSKFWNPWALTERTTDRSLKSIQDEMNQLFNSFWNDGFATSFAGNAHFVPKLDIKETPNEVQVTAELPGVDEKDVNVEFHDGTLTIRGEKRFEKEDKDKTYHRIERHYGSFQRAIGVPSYVDPEKISASFKNGLLQVTMGKKTEAQTGKRTITIKS